MNITEFKTGDKITRIEPAKSIGYTNTLTGEAFERPGDRSYIGDKLEFIRVANGSAYFNRDKESAEYAVLGEKLDIRLDIFSEGWDRFIESDPTN